MFACDGDLRISFWNEGAERLTGVPAGNAVGEPCWWVLSGRADDGSLVCHQGCSTARLARQGWPIGTRNLTIRTPEGEKRIAVDVISSFEDSSFSMIHVMHESPEETPEAADAHAQLTPRQQQVLGLLNEGLRVREIAKRLGLSEATIRNHIRAVLAELRAHSQLQAVHNAREDGLLS